MQDGRIGRHCGRVGRIVTAFLTLIVVAAGCAGQSPSAGALSSVPAASAVLPRASASSPAFLVVGGDRPVTVHIPASYDRSRPAPLLIVLHGFTVSGEEVATYFERHKHELPRSHEVCVKRYQSNEKQIRELDAKYGNLVSMIQGLGEKHQNYLPKEPDAEEADVNNDDAEDDAKRDEKVRKWASSVSAQAGQDTGHAEEEERTPHFERPLRDVRVGESPSRPWGISVPVKYVEEAAARSEGSSSPVKLRHTSVNPKPDQATGGKTGKCPFGFDKIDEPQVEAKIPQQDQKSAQPVFIDPGPKVHKASVDDNSATEQTEKRSNMVFTGPVFLGYSAEDAAKILRQCGLDKSS